MESRKKHTSFQLAVFAKARRIPMGRVSTYAALARALGKPRAARAVGNALNKSPGMPDCPCHRVVKSNGEVGGFAAGTKKKIKLLRKEGIGVLKGKVDLKIFSF